MRVKIRTKNSCYWISLVCCICVLISMEKSMLRICSVFISVPITFHSLHQVWQRSPLVSALELCCCRVIPLANQELTFYKRISCHCGMDCHKPRLGEYTSFELALIPVSAWGFALCTHLIINFLWPLYQLAEVIFHGDGTFKGGTCKFL